MGAQEIDLLITPDGITYALDGVKDRVMTTQFDGQGMPSIEYVTERGPLQQGQTVLAYKLQPRVMQIAFRRSGHDREQYWSLRQELINQLRPNRLQTGTVPTPCVIRKILPGHIFRDIDVLIQQGPDFSSGDGNWDEFGFTEGLRFIAHDPTFYDPEAHVETFLFNAIAGLVVPTSYPLVFGSGTTSLTLDITYVGTWISYPVITITGPIDAASITNTTTDETLGFSKPLGLGEQVVIDTRFGHKSVYDPLLAPSDPEYNLIYAVSGDLGTFHIEASPQAPGGLNHLEVTLFGVDPTGSVAIQYYDRYIGL